MSCGVCREWKEKRGWVEEPDQEKAEIRCECGTTWREATQKTLPEGLTKGRYMGRVVSEMNLESRLRERLTDVFMIKSSDGGTCLVGWDAGNKYWVCERCGKGVVLCPHIVSVVVANLYAHEVKDEAEAVEARQKLHEVK